MEKNLFILNKEVKSLGKYHKFQNYLLFETKKKQILWSMIHSTSRKLLFACEIEQSRSYSETPSVCEQIYSL